MPMQHASDHGSHSEEAPSGCTCKGGLCVLALVLHPVLASPQDVIVDAGWDAAFVPSRLVVLPARSEYGRQPPGRGPPAVV
jgi:hypothetical protein